MGKKKLGIIIGAVVIVVAAIVLAIIFLGGNKEKKLSTNLNTLGKQFYEEFYYPSQEKSQDDVKSFIKKFEKTGIKVNLENIAKISKVDQDLLKTMGISKEKSDSKVKTIAKCDTSNTYVIIKPKKPYGKTDYSIEINLDCGLNK